MKKQGFTLIELLAVIVILSIILLIAIPIVLRVIGDSKNESAKDSLKLYGKTVENAVANYFVKYPEEDYVTFDKLKQENLIQYNGTKVECEKVYIPNKEVFLSDCKVGDKKMDETYGRKIKNMMAEATLDSLADGDLNLYYFLNTQIKNKDISNLNIYTDGRILTGYDRTDCSYNHDGSVMCYYKEDTDPDNAGYYEMNLVADGEIYTPFDSSDLFNHFGYKNLQNLDLTGINTIYTIDMNSMFQSTGYTSMTSLDLGDKFDTSNVIRMTNMFHSVGLKLMTSLDLGDKFDTSNVNRMDGMFVSAGRENLTKLDLGNKFNTENVKNMWIMFWSTGEYGMTSLDLGKEFIINDDTDTDGMFEFCGINDTSMRVYVGSQELKNKIKNMTDNSMRQFWKTNDSIIVVR